MDIRMLQDEQVGRIKLIKGNKYKVLNEEGAKLVKEKKAVDLKGSLTAAEAKAVKEASAKQK